MFRGNCSSQEMKMKVYMFCHSINDNQSFNFDDNISFNSYILIWVFVK